MVQKFSRTISIVKKLHLIEMVYVIFIFFSKKCDISCNVEYMRSEIPLKWSINKLLLSCACALLSLNRYILDNCPRIMFNGLLK